MPKRSSVASAAIGYWRARKPVLFFGPGYPGGSKNQDPPYLLSPLPFTGSGGSVLQADGANFDPSGSSRKFVLV
jgi:hypothetical protein